MRTRSRTPTERELEILKIIWQAEPATVRDVYETLRRRRSIACTTCMTIMNILREKGYLKRRIEKRAFVYQTTRPRGEVIKRMVRVFVDHVFNGSFEPLLVYLLEDWHFSPKAER
jgi:predicted transcriptional regulator